MLKKSKGLSLHIGLNSVDPKHYDGWAGELTACEADATDMKAIAKTNGYQSKTLLTKSATIAAVRKSMKDAADKLQSGDIFFISYSGHGGQLPDWSRDELDMQDETWCLYDGEIVDDELYELYAGFRKGVRIIVLSDSCHSGTVVKMAYYHSPGKGAPEKGKYRVMPDDVALRTYTANKAYYDPILKNPKYKNIADKVKASLILLSGCQDNQYSSDGTFNGLFTGTLLRVWAEGTFKGGYKEFHTAIVRRMPPDQTPNYFTIGTPNPSFEKAGPFKI